MKYYSIDYPFDENNKHVLSKTFKANVANLFLRDYVSLRLYLMHPLTCFPKDNMAMHGSLHNLQISIKARSKNC